MAIQVPHSHPRDTFGTGSSSGEAFIGNEDRHENNFDVIVRDGKNYAPPIYDNGGSLLAWAIDEELTDTKLRYQFDKAKPFRSHHAQQIKMIDEPVLPTRDLDELYSEIIQSISPILALLSEKRASAIRQYLKYRWRGPRNSQLN